jgi:hypothetical protein
MTDVDLFLEHFGVAGMKWGIRKARANIQIETNVRKHQLINKGSNFTSGFLHRNAKKSLAETALKFKADEEAFNKQMNFFKSRDYATKPWTVDSSGTVSK